jgi:sugar-specific transcriptional regulator TrmB
VSETATQTERLLRGFGFTEYEVKAYLALLAKSPVTGYELSKQSGIPRSRVYDVLTRLEEKGAAMVTDTDPAQYAPLPPEALIERIRTELQTSIGSLESLRASLESVTIAEGGAQVWTLRGYKTMISKARTMIRMAVSEVLVVAAREELEALDPDLAEAEGRGVTVLALEQVGLPGTDGLLPDDPSPLASWAGRFMLLVKDASEALVSGVLGRGEPDLLWSSSPALVHLARAYARPLVVRE